ncbi:MAG: phosphate ABC transporter substrate-binding protein [Deltaproteobacteria bacterium]|jgi:phosphate transport system substrate-binding protein|nr:phosphate ABC transporter substrate-binding protein [Deltaproteobacteria bacterium]
MAKTVLAFWAIFLLASAAWAQDPVRGETVRISGSTTLLPITEKAAEEYLKENPGETLTVSGTGSGEGIKSLIDGVIDLAGASRDLKPAETERAARQGVRLVKRIAARDGLAVVVHPGNPVRNLTLAQLRGIYLGTVTNWRQVGGEDRVIVPINRDSSSGTFEMWVEMVLLGQRHRPDAQVQSSSGAVAYAVAGNRCAVGYTGLGFLSPKVAVAAVGGVKASLEAVTDGTYPIARDLYIFSREDISRSAQKFLDYLLGPRGQALLGAEGFAPARDSAL